jgi:sodium transport system ATP-binding protein
MEEKLKACGIVKCYGQFKALDQFFMSVHAGEVVGLLGPNGAGKTTALRILAGILTPTEGEVLVDGQEIHGDLLAAKRKIGFLSGDTQLYQRLSPREVLFFFGRLYGMKEHPLRDRIEKLVQDLEMSDYASRPCGTLSSGQKQRANIARAFLHQPEVLILDEPTTALDVISGQFIVESIRREKTAGRAVLFSTHIMGEAEYLCDRIYLLHQGRVIDHGSLEEILERSACRNLTDSFLKFSGHAHQANPATTDLSIPESIL